MVCIVSSIEERHIARSLAQSLYVLLGKEVEAPAPKQSGRYLPIRDAFQEMTVDPVLWSYLDVIEASQPADEVFRGLTADPDPNVAALAISALARIDAAGANSMAADLSARIETPSHLVEDTLAGVRRGARADSIVVIAELLAVEYVFAALDLGTLGRIARKSALATFRAGDQICRVGDSPDSMFVLVLGETEAWIDGEHGRHVLGRSKPGGVFGELGIISGQPRAASIEVVSATAEVITIPREVIDDILSRNHHATRGILTVVSGYLRSTLAGAGQRSDVTQQPAAARPPPTDRETTAAA